MSSPAKEAWPSDVPNLPRQPSVFVMRAHATLPAFDTSNAFRNARDNFTLEHAARWAAHRRACASEMTFKVRAFMWTLLIEMIPCFIAAPLVTCMSGLQEAMNRELLQGIPLDPIYGAFVPWTLVVIYIWARDELPDDAIYEVIGVMLFHVGGAATIAVKYALYPEAILADESEPLHIKSKAYEEANLRDRNLMMTYVLNATGHQRMELVKILYKSCLYMDVDLSTAFFHVSDEPISDDPHVSACAMWEGCLASIAEVYTSDLAEGARESSDVQGPGAPELTRRFSLPSMTTEVQRVVPEAPAPAEPDSACPDKEELHRRASAQSRVHAEAAPGALAESLDDGVLLATFFRSRNTDITALVRGGKIPATVVALNLIFKCFYRPKRAGFRIFFGAMFCSIVVGVCTQPFLRMAVGKSPFGDLPREQAYRGYLAWAQFPGIFILWYFNIAPILWYYSKLKLARQLHAMIAGRVHSYTCGGGLRLAWNAGVHDGRDAGGSLRLDMRSYEDVAAWAALRQVLHGGNFGPIIHRKFQLYGCIIFSLFLALPTIQAIGSFYQSYDSASGKEHVINLDVKCLTLLRLLILALPIMIQVFICHWVNRYSEFQQEALYRAQRSNMALAAQLRGRGPELAAQADELERCQILLGCIADEIRVCKDTSPMRVLGLVAQPSVVFTLTSILTSILVLEVRDLGVIPFLS